MATDLIYVDESFNGSRTVVSALGVRDTAWKGVFSDLKSWRGSLRTRYGIRLAKELHASPFLAGKGSLGPRTVTKYQRSTIFLELMDLLAAQNPNDVWIINACLKGSPGVGTKLLATERLTNRVQRCLKARDSQGVVFFDEGLEPQLRRLFRKLRAHNPIPSMFGSWGDGSPTQNIVADRILGDPVFVQSHRDYFIQAVDFVAHALLRAEEPPSAKTLRYNIHTGFARLSPVLNKKASTSDPMGIVRR